MRVSVYVYDRCSARAEDDGYQPEGWVHSQVGDDLCPKCQG